jgi:uncharacterized Zn-finger protein
MLPLIFFSLEITSSTVGTFDGPIQSEISGPKLIVVVERLKDEVIQELTAGIWRCDSCGKTEKSLLILDLHFDTGCEKLSPIECDVCPAVVHEYRDFVAHFLEHQMGETRKCPICLCEYIGDMKQHLIIKGHISPNLSELDLQGNASLGASQNPFSSACSSSIESYSEAKGLDKQKTYLNSHFYGKKHRKLEKFPRIHAGKKLYKCDVCNKCFSSPSKLNLHQRVHTGEKPFKCDACNKCFSSSGNLIQHQSTHTGEKHFQCDVCKKYFSQFSHLNTHQRVHTGEKPFKCNVCNKCFSVSGSLIRHQRVHTGEKPFQCDTCKKCFSVSSALIQHQRVHTGEKPFKCNVCNKCFSESGSLIKHQRVHTGEKPFKCNVCNKWFSESGSLIKHQRVHTGEKPFQCDTCKKCFSQSSNLIMHQKRHIG